ncbi:MAG: SdpI family protein [bacterium]|nr:SdpI family protein [bacterium]
MKNPVKYSLRTEIWPLLILLAAIGLSLWAYPQLSARVITHWNFNGQANGWGSREFHAIFFPALLAAIYVLFIFLPKLDPLGARYQEFAGVYRAMRTLILLVLLVVFVAATLANLGYAINIGATVAGAVGLMMIILGNYFKKLKRNFFVGIRTPWTLSSDNVWDKTHLLGGRLFMLWGLGLILAPWLAPVAAFIILFGGMAVIIAWVCIYSYVLYKKEKKDGI